jgi:hypothetical protein
MSSNDELRTSNQLHASSPRVEVNSHARPHFVRLVLKLKRGLGIGFSEGMVKEAYALSSQDFLGYTT